jgi:hypothetical protein
MLDPRDQVTPDELQQLAPGASLQHDATIRLAEVTPGVYRAAVHGADGESLGERRPALGATISFARPAGVAFLVSILLFVALVAWLTRGSHG